MQGPVSAAIHVQVAAQIKSLVSSLRTELMGVQLRFNCIQKSVHSICPRRKRLPELLLQERESGGGRRNCKSLREMAMDSGDQ